MEVFTGPTDTKVLGSVFFDLIWFSLSLFVDYYKNIYKIKSHLSYTDEEHMSLTAVVMGEVCWCAIASPWSRLRWLIPSVLIQVAMDIHPHTEKLN